MYFESIGINDDDFKMLGFYHLRAYGMEAISILSISH